MVQGPREETFERDGKTLQQWLPDLLARNPALRRKAGDWIVAMYLGVPSVHSDVEEVVGDKPNREDYQAAWQAAVESAVNAPGFPRRSFFVGAAARLIGNHDKYLSELGRGDEQYERI